MISITIGIRRRRSIRLWGWLICGRTGWPEEMLHAILAHADYSGVVPETHLERALFASDELAGFLTACALVKPSKAIAEVEVAGVKKKMKDKAFARAVKREDITRGAELLGIPCGGAHWELPAGDAGTCGGVGAVGGCFVSGSRAGWRAK